MRDKLHRVGVQLLSDQRLNKFIGRDFRREDLAGFFASTVGDEPSGRFGKEVNSEELDEGEGSLEKRGDSPAPC